MITQNKKAFTLVELIIVLLMMGTLAFIAVPRINMGISAKYKAETTARKIASAIRKTRSLAISNAATNTAGYELKFTGTQFGTFTIVNLSNRETIETQDIDSAVSCSGANKFTFGPLGNRLNDTGALTVSADGKITVISVISATGMVRCTESQ